jgi:hypothetical protein
MSGGNIYLIHAQGTDRYKIGLTTVTVKKRLKQLNGQQSPFELVVRHSIEVEKVRVAEKYFHDKYKECNAHNEWFKFSEAEVCEVVELMTSYQLDKRKQEENQNQDKNLVLEINNPIHQIKEKNQDEALEIKKEDLIFSWAKKILIFFVCVLIATPIILFEFIKIIFRLRGIIPKILLWIKKVIVFSFYILFFPPMLLI